MREILFRGKRINNSEWVEGGIIPLDTDSGYVFIAEPFLSASTLPVYEIIKHHTHLVIPESVSEFTGLTDKNGKRIFEGDIVRNIFNGEELAGKVEYSDGSFGVRFADGSGQFICFFTQCEVIGNIHDNPELLNPSFKPEYRDGDPDCPICPNCRTPLNEMEDCDCGQKIDWSEE